ncbi:hypothetical protein FHK02_5422 [Spirosoma sp. LMG 31448]|uniref:Transposase n=1 Tax=Spirosoma utsteinense TaxID=2585773 RepID=A0ABR6WE32_9BACT|nr:hypothetical protein [Spirosoma utsteinense]MBC3794796.1 hypothetical protein [Spirosoma utsteinense]
MFRQVPESVHRSYLAEALRCSCRSWFSLAVNGIKLHGQILESCNGVNLKADAAKEMFGRYFSHYNRRAAPQHRLHRSIGFVTPQQKWEEAQVVYDTTFSENLSS